MHVAQFVHRYPPALGGAESYIARLCKHLTDRGDHVSVWTTTAIDLEGFRLRGHRHITANDTLDPNLSITRYAPLHFPARRYLLKALSLVPVRQWQCLTTPCNPICPAMWRDAGRYDGLLGAVHATAFPYSFPIACGLRLARRRGVPFFLTPFLHLGDRDDSRDRTRRQYTTPHLQWLLRQADGVFVQTRIERDAVIALGVLESRVHLQGLGIDPAECTGGDREATRIRCSIEPGEIAIGHLANNSAEKGTVALLQAAERLWARGLHFQVVLAGPEMPNFRAYWREFPHKDHVTRLGVLSDEQKRDFFAAIDAFALPSRTDSFGLVLLEAWANAKPNLVYRAGGPAELVRDGIDGLHARCGDVEGLAAQLSRLVSDADLRRSLGERGRARLDREFRWQNKLELARRLMTGAKFTEDKGKTRPRAKPGAEKELASVKRRGGGAHAES